MSIWYYYCFLGRTAKVWMVPISISSLSFVKVTQSYVYQ